MKPFNFTEVKPVWVFLIFFMLGLLAYGNAINHPFVHDDVVFISANPRIGVFDFKDIFQPRKTEGPAAGLLNVYYRPLIELLYRVEYKLFGLQAFAYHLFNIVIHLVNAFLLYLILGRIFPSRTNINFITALFFLIHPVQTEAVACISGISNLFFTLALFSGFLLYLRGRDQKSGACYAAAAVLLFLGCFIKEQMIVLPVLVLFYELVFHGGKDRRYARALGLFLVLAGYFLFRKMILGTPLSNIFDPYGEYMLRFMAIPRSILMYLSIILVPVNLHYYRSLDVLQPNTASWIGLGILLAGFAGILFKCGGDRRKTVLFGAGWFVITLLPVLNIIPLVNEYSTILNFEHFLYLPLIGILIIVAALFEYFLVPRFKLSSRTVSAVCLVLVVAAIALTVKQNTYWRSEIALFTRALKYQESGRIRILLGKAYYFNQDFHRAVEEYNKAEAIMQGYVRKAKPEHIKAFYRGYLKGIYFDLAHCYESLQNKAEAVRMYQLALEIDPRDPVLYNNLAVVYIRENDLDRAIEELEKALAVDRGHPQTRQNLAYCYFQTGRKEKAEQLIKGIK
ncbi:MAG: tetratricopeptide repeat protein [Candidatus Omnitrophota bacterium]